MRLHATSSVIVQIKIEKGQHKSYVCMEDETNNFTKKKLLCPRYGWETRINVSTSTNHMHYVYLLYFIYLRK